MFSFSADRSSDSTASRLATITSEADDESPRKFDKAICKSTRAASVEEDQGADAGPKQEDLHFIRVIDHAYLTYRSVLTYLLTEEPVFYAPLESLGIEGALGFEMERPAIKAVYALAQ